MVNKTKHVVVWDKPAYASLQKAYERIKKDSPANAEKVREGILKTARGLADHPEKYPPDKFKADNQGDYRAFEWFSYRVAIKVKKNEIIILRVRHVKQEPKEY